jgi:hypothetical protein
MNDVEMTWISAYFQIQPSFSDVGLWRFFVNESGASESSYGITVVHLDGNSVDQIWDRIQILTTSVDDNRVDVDSDAELRVTAQLEYDSHPIGAGDTLYLNGVLMSWDSGDSRFELLRSKASVGLWTYFVNSTGALEATHGITLVNLNGNAQDVVWDRIRILTTQAANGRINYGTTTTISVTAMLEYDGHVLGSGDTLFMNDTVMLWGTDHFYLTTGSYEIVDLISYFVNSTSANEATYGIAALNVDGQSTTVIWDRIQILTTTVSDSRLDVNANAELRVTAQLEYDSHPLGSGDTLYMDDVQMIWDSGDSRFELLRTQASVGLWIYYVNLSNAYEATYGITLLDINGQNQDVVWDRIQILTTTTEDGRIDYGTAADIRVTAELEYDGHVLGSADTLYMNGTSMSWVSSYFQLQPQFSQVGLWSFFVNTSSANEVTYGISLVNLDSKSVDQIWDRILVLTTTVDDSRIDVNANAELRVTAELEYDGHPLGSGDSLYMDDIQMSWDGANIWFELTRLQSSVGLWNYNINSSNALEATFGITIVNLDGNSQDVIWDRIRILTTITQNDRIDYGSSADIRVTAELEFDHHLLGSGDTLYMGNIRHLCCESRREECGPDLGSIESN